MSFLTISEFGDFVIVIYEKSRDLGYHKPTNASYLYLHLRIDSRGRLSTNLFDERDDFSLTFVATFLQRRRRMECIYHSLFVTQELMTFWRILTYKLLKQGFVTETLKSSLKMFFGHHHEWVDRYETSVSHMRSDLFL